MLLPLRITVACHVRWLEGSHAFSMTLFTVLPAYRAHAGAIAPSFRGATKTVRAA
jgi:hypothetical protein